MNRKAYNRVLDESVIEHDGKLYAWTIPISLPVTSELAARLKPGQTVALTNSAGDIVATLELDDVFEWDKPRLHQERLPDRPRGSSRRRHGAQGRCRQDPPAGRKDSRSAAAQAGQVRQVRAFAARSSKAAGHEGLGPRRGIPDPQPAAPGSRIRTGLRLGDAAQGRPQRRRGAESR